MKNALNLKKIISLTIVTVVLFCLLFTLFACNDLDDSSSKNFVMTDGIRLLDENGNPIGLYGTNLGGWLVQEGWMCPTTDGDTPFAQVDIMLTLYNRFGQEKAENLIDIYENNWISEQDFVNIKSLGLNCVRIPFSYLNFMNVLTYDDDLSTWVKTPFEQLALKEDWFKRIDWALDMCDKYGLYAILDMHGAVGSQSGQDHSGDISAQVGRLWNDDDIGQVCRDKTKELWVEIAKRYKERKCVAAYDILNEPGVATIDSNGNKSQFTTEVTWQYFDQLIKAIRMVDTNHVICVESCWEPYNLPSLDKYGWENMLYQYHQYNWSQNNMLNAGYYNLKVMMTDSLAKRNYPVLIGEFCVWGDEQRKNGSPQTDKEALAGVVELYCGKGWSFTTWSYKVAFGYSNWGLYNFDESKSTLEKANYRTSSYDEIASIWAGHNTNNYYKNADVVDSIIPYLDGFYTGDSIKDTQEEYYILDNIK